MQLAVVEPGNGKHLGICDTYHVTDIDDFAALMRLYDQVDDERQDCHCLLSMDDLYQMQYTSMHATMSHDLDNSDGHDLSAVSEVAFEDGEHVGYLSTPSEFFIRRANFLSAAKPITFADACRRGLSIEPAELALLQAITDRPASYFDAQSLIYAVPVAKENTALAICAIPNGYFTSDLNPFESYAVAKHLQETYGYQLFGVGASLFGFRQQRALAANEVEELANDLAALYNQTDDKVIISGLTDLVQTSSYLFVKYVEYLESK